MNTVQKLVGKAIIPPCPYDGDDPEERKQWPFPSRGYSGGLDRLHAEDFSKAIAFANRKLQERGQPILLTPEEAERSLKQYYALPILEFPRRQFAISSIVDEYWHAHLLYTKDYREFCERVYGHFADHYPLDTDDTVEYARIRDMYIDTRELLLKHFGDKVCEAAYPAVKEGVVICSFDYCVGMIITH